VPDVPAFLPSRNGLAFTNPWPAEPDIVVDVPVVGKIAVGSASNGLCGGMVFTVLDTVTAGRPSPLGLVTVSSSDPGELGENTPADPSTPEP
jgi:hypothetical protein